MRCPVKGCEPWAALDKAPGALPQPQAMVTKDGAYLARRSGDCAKIDATRLCGPKSKSVSEHGCRGLETVIEHWCAFHLKEGGCFSAPCCSRTPVESLDQKCHRACFTSITLAVEHLVDDHLEEVQTRQAYQKEFKAAEGEPSRRKRGSRASQENEILRNVDPNDLRSVGRLMVVEFMDVYSTKIGIPRMIGRTHWYTNTNLARVIVGFHLPQIPEETSKKWSKDHHKYLENCRKDFAAWTATLPGYDGAPAPLTSGYAEAA
jgi:hypothetical protein